MSADRAIALVDGHVHVHDCFDVDTLLDAAASNFAASARGLDAGDSPACVLMMTESRGENYFGAFAGMTGGGGRAGWRFRHTRDDHSLVTERGEAEEIILVAGRQIVTNDDLEVLALGTNRQIPDGRDLETTVHEVLDHDALAVVPWGFGKWSMRRKEILSKIVDSIDRPGFFLGDNAGRPSAGLRPELFDVAAERGIWNLPGSDPLPFPSQVERAGSYAFVLDAALDPDEPARGIREAILALEAQPTIVGNLERLGSFCLNQLRMQIRKRVS